MKQYITVKQLKVLFDKIINKLEFDGFEQIEIARDFHSYIPSADWDKLENHNVVFGSFFDDLDWLKKLVQDDGQPTATYVDFDRIAHILKLISETENPEID